MKPLTMKETLEIMVAETQNEITKNEIMIRLCNREMLKGHKDKNVTMVGMLQSKNRALTSSVTNLTEFLREELDKEAKIVKE